MSKISIYNKNDMKYRRRDLRKKMTDAEKILWEKLRNNKLGVKFRRQYSVMGYVIDFYCPEKRLAIEIDGGIHEKTSKYDQYRTRYLEALNIKVIRFKNEEVTEDVSKVVKMLLIQ